jgi:hypothetical protein
VFDEAMLPDGYSLDETPSSTNDECHRNIEGISDNRAKKWFKRLQNPVFQICDGDTPHALTREDIQRELLEFNQRLR